MIRPARLFVRLLTLAAVLALVQFIPFTPAAPATYFWDTYSGDWNEPSNWVLDSGTPSTPPTVNDNAIIDNGGNAIISTGDPATAKNLTVGKYYIGSVIHYGNTLLLGQNLTIGANEGSYGAYYLYYLTGDPSSFILNVGQNLIVGHAGSGHFGQSGGTVTVYNDLILGYQAGSYGSYNFEESGANTSSLKVKGNLIVGDAGYGYFNQSGGTVTVVKDLILGYQGGSSGEYYFDYEKKNTSSLEVTGNLIVGHAGSGYFEQSAGQVTVGQNLILGNQTSDSSGRYFISGTPESSILNVTGNLIVGHAGSGYFEQSGGQVTVGRDLILGNLTPDSSGTYKLPEEASGVAPSLTVSRDLIIGNKGEGYFDHSSGTVTVERDLILGNGGSGYGEYNFSGGTLGVTGNLIVGHAGSGYFEQSAGQVTVGQNLILGNQAGSSGSYSFGWWANTSSLEVKGNLIVGQAGYGYFFQSGGTVTVGQATGAGSLIVGASGQGYFSHYDGTLNTNRLIIGQNAGSQGVYELQGGTLNTPTMVVGQEGQGHFFQRGGSLNVTDTLTVKAGSGSGTFLQDGGDSYINNFENNGTVQFSYLTGEVGSSAYIGTMTNCGIVRVTSATVTFGSYTERGNYISDPSLTIILADLTVEKNGYLEGDYGSTWQIGNDFNNISTQNTNWNTRRATLVFVNGNGAGTYGYATHVLQLTGEDQGDQSSGYLNNFAWGVLDLSSQDVYLQGGERKALYVGEILGANIVDRTVTNIHSSLNVYYDLALNQSLRGIYELDGGGQLIPVSYVTTLWTYTNTSTPGDWHSEGNWSQGVPIASEDAFIDTGTTASITADAVAQNLFVGHTSSGAVEQSGSSLTVIYDLILGNYGGTGTYTQSGGQVTVGRDLILGNLTPDSSGTYNLPEEASGVAPSLTVSRDLIIGNKGEGYFDHSSGTVTVKRDLILGNGGSGYGEYNFSGGTLGVTGNLIVSNEGVGEFYQTGGQVTVTQDLVLGNLGSFFGFFYGDYFIRGDSSTSLKASNLIVGQAGSGFFEQSGGTVTVGQDLILGYQGGSYGEYYFDYEGYNTSVLEVKGSLIVGYAGWGEFTHSAGTITAREVLLGRDTAGVGIYLLQGGTLTAQSLGVGFAGRGDFSQDGGEVNLNYLEVGGLAGSTGSYQMSDGSLTITPKKPWSPSITLGREAGSQGTFELSGTGTINAPVMSVGANGTGTFNQSGGEVSLNYLEVGAMPGSTGFYQMEGGSLTITEDPESDPSKKLSPSITLGREAGSQGTFELSGTRTINAPVMSVGKNGTGTFNQSGGAVSLHYLEVGAMPGSTGRYQMSDGSLTITKAGDWSPSITLGRDAGSQGTFLMSGGTVSAPELHVSSGGQGTFTQTGGNSSFSYVENKGSMTFDRSGGAAMSANLTEVTNNASGQVTVTGTGPTDAFLTVGNMTNYGKVKVTSATVTFGSYTENGSYTSDPATTIILVNLDVKETGYLVGGTGDTWQIGNDFYNTSTQNIKWNTRNANLVFVTGTGTGDGQNDASHKLQIPGVDLGPNPSGYLNNFAWGTLDLLEGESSYQTLYLEDPNGGGGALYVGAIEGLLISGSTITNIRSITGLNIYYDPSLNPELEGKTYYFAGGGALAPVPLPGSVWLLLTGLAGLALVARRRRARAG